MAKPTSNPPLRPCHVLISGAGIAGLTLALALEKNNITFTLLESYPEIIPQVGAGICLLPNGLRILDQLGVYDDLKDRVKDVLETVSIRDPEGKTLHFSSGWETIMSERWGYAGIWCDRSTILQTLYDHIRDKSRILANKRLDSVVYTEKNVQVTTADGSVYKGDILIGTDGTHSRVREEMVRLAREAGAGEAYADDDVTATYACLFGLSSSTPGLTKGLLGWNLGKNFSYIIGTGPKDRTYWLLSQKLDQTYHGREIPRFTDEDQERFVKEHWDDQITETLRLSDLYESRKHLVCKPLREVIWKKWWFGRAVVLGDAGHAMLPIIAQGGNQAIESVAAITNALLAALARPSLHNSDEDGDGDFGSLSQEEIDSLFKQFQSARESRVSEIASVGRIRQQMDAMETPELEELMLGKFPSMLPGGLVERWDETFAPAVSLVSPRGPARVKTFLYDDEGESVDGQAAKL
ncbi:hypothetical protein BJY04DRAFT_227519 [Aspergillus karnatakaensis]|uniref:FAD-dependent oxidoreductase n=1 Tax=Aspergillus karnatakaensis TaxID=1810916 RepID=UPI003CCD8613